MAGAGKEQHVVTKKPAFEAGFSIQLIKMPNLIADNDPGADSYLIIEMFDIFIGHANAA
jgi:hypothetical protein